MSPLTVGTKVRYSPYALRDLRDGWQREGSPSKKAVKKRWYDDKAALRGTITGTANNGYAIRWDNGDESTVLSYLVVPVT